MMAPIRVLHLVDSLKLGGIQTFLRDVLPDLASAGVEVRLAALHGPGPFSEILVQRGIVPIHLASSKWNPAIPFRLAQILRQSPVDILHAHGVPSCWLGERLYRWGRVPHLVQHIHHLYRGQHGQFVLNQIEGMAYRHGDVLATCSHAVADSVPSNLVKQVIYNGVETAHLRPPTAAEREAARAHFGFSSSDHVFCMVGRLTRDKGVYRVCEAVAKLAQANPNVRLLLAGTGPDEKRIRAFCAGAGLEEKVVFAGFLDDVRPCFHAADSAVMASAKEGLNLAMLEGMATGLATVVVDSPATREVVVDGESARVFYESPSASLMGALQEQMVDPDLRRRLGKEGRALVEEKFSLKTTVMAFRTLYEDVVASGPATNR